MSIISSIKIGYAGMTHLGINYAVASACKIFNIVGYDKIPLAILRLSNLFGHGDPYNSYGPIDFYA